MITTLCAILIGLLPADRALADRLLRAGDRPGARRVFEELLAEAGDAAARAELLDRIGVTYLGDGALWEAEARFSDSLRLRDTSVTRLHRGKTYFFAGQRSAQEPGAVSAEVRALMNDAARDLERCLEMDEKMTEAWVYLGLCESYRFERDNAAKAYVRALALEPARPDASFYLALIREEEGDPKAALELLEGVEEGARWLDLHLARGRLAGALGDTGRLRAAYRDAALLAPDDDRAYYALWKAVSGEKRFAELASDLQVVLDRHPESWLPHYYLGFCRMSAKEFPKAIAAFEEVLRRRPEWQDPRLKIAEIHRRDLRDEDTAIPMYLEVLEREPTNRGALGTVGMIAARRASAGDLETAARLLRVLCEATPSEPLHVLNLAVVLRDGGRSEEALALYDRAMDEFPFDPRIPNDRGLLLMGLGREADALASFGIALDRDPDDLNGLENMGAYARLRGDFEAAVGYFLRAQRIVLGQGKDAGKFRRYLDVVAREAQEAR